VSVHALPRELSIITGEPAGGTNDIHAGAEVAMAYTPEAFPLITRLKLGDAYPLDARFGSGSEVLWGRGYDAGDGDFFVALLFSTYRTGPTYQGWLHLTVQNSSTPRPTVTLIDWVYADGGERLRMGQVSEPSTLTLLALPVLAGLLSRLISFFFRRSPV